MPIAILLICSQRLNTGYSQILLFLSQWEEFFATLALPFMNQCDRCIDLFFSLQLVSAETLRFSHRMQVIFERISGSFQLRFVILGMNLRQVLPQRVVWHSQLLANALSCVPSRVGRSFFGFQVGQDVSKGIG